MNHEMRGQRRYSAVVLCPLAAICLAACGGGSNAGEPAANPGQPSQLEGTATAVAAGVAVPGTAPVPEPRPPAVSREAGLPVSANTTAQRNTRYDITGTGAAAIELTLPQFIVPGDFVSVRGVSGRPWRIVPNCCPGTTARSDMTPQAVITTSLPGNIAPGQRWAPRMAQKQWHAAASSQDGQVLVAADNPGNLHVSTDAGVNWSAGNSPTGQAWVSVVVKTTPYPFPAASAVSMVAVAAGGGMYRSIDRGVTWIQLASDDAGVALSGRQWQSVTSDQTGNVVAAAVMNGPIYRSGNSGSTTGWQTGTLEGSSTALERPWRALAASADAGIMVAASDKGEVYVSTTAGRTWALRNVTVGGRNVTSAWHRVAMSDDGNTIAIAGGTNAGLYVSRDRGLSWAQTPAPTGDYTALTMSADGKVIGATLTNGVGSPTIGSVQVSRDGGGSFTALSLPGQDRNWRAFSMAGDGNQFVVAAGTSGSVAGQLYTSLGNRTSIGTAGFIGGGINDFVELEYLGNARFKIRAFDGGPFTIR
jgi:hypothetical protein